VRLFKPALVLAVVGIFVTAGSAGAHHPQSAWTTLGGIGWLDPDMKKVQDLRQAANSPAIAQAVGFTPCVDGQAGVYPCNNVDLMSFLPLAEIGGGEIGNDIWGWEDPATGRNYAIMGRTNGTAFVDITDPANPVYVGNLPSESTSSAFIFWRDIKVYENHAFIVSEHRGHGMQVFDLTRLRDVTSTPATFDADTVYRRITSAHNLFINEDTGFAYVVGSNRCRGGLHIVDVSEPQNPRFVACYSEDGYTHDVQCVIYEGPDDRFTGREICFASNEDTVTIVDLTDKQNPVMLARRGYATASYTHQGWLTPDQATFVFNDELDELTGAVPRQTSYILDVSSLTDPPPPVLSTNRTTAIDHNLYITKGLVFESNYTAGLQIFDAASITSGQLSEVAWFDVYPANDDPIFEGTWSNYAFYDENIVAVSGIDSGLFVLRPQLGG
jgi:choice-of-anchor B domain-containing protein